MSLLDLHQEMLKQAEVNEVDKQRVEVISEYAKLAEAALDQEYGEGKYSQDDVVKVAQALIDQDIELEENMMKVAEFDEAGRIMARAFIDEVSQNATE